MRPAADESKSSFELRQWWAVAALNHAAASVFYCVELKEAAACDSELELPRTQDLASIYVWFGRKSPGTSWWMSVSKGERHVNRRRDESRRNLEYFSAAVLSVKGVQRAARPSIQAAPPADSVRTPSALCLLWITPSGLVKKKKSWDGISRPGPPLC